MPTDKEPTPTPTPASPPAPAATHAPVAVSSYRHRLLIALCGVVLIIALSSASLLWLDWQTKHDSQAGKASATHKAATASDTEITCADDLMKYRNEDLKLGFCYPSTWGSVVMQNARWQEADTGSRWQAVFSANPATRITFTSKDWKSKAAKDLTCQNPAATADETKYTATWQTTRPAAASPTSVGIYGTELVPKKYLIREVASTTAKGVCLEGYLLLGGKTYTSAVVTTQADFTTAIPTVDAHMAAPQTLLPQAVRTNLSDVLQSATEL